MLTRKQSKKVLCGICLQVSQDVIGRIQCKHNYCFQCIHKWATVKNKCPTCKRKISKVLKHIVDKPNQSKGLKLIEPEQFPIESEPISQQESQQDVQQLQNQIIRETLRQPTSSENTPTLQLRSPATTFRRTILPRFFPIRRRRLIRYNGERM